jgi:hypothetical protein
MISALLMWRRLTKALRHAMREEDFAPVLSAGGVLIVIGTLTYTFGNGWKLVDGFYFAVATLTTSKHRGFESRSARFLDEGLHRVLHPDWHRDLG